jgi:hypothetical protein
VLGGETDEVKKCGLWIRVGGGEGARGEGRAAAGGRILLKIEEATGEGRV